MIVCFLFYPCKCAVQVNGIVMGMGEVAVFNYKISGRTRSVDAVRIAYGDMPRAFSWHKIAVIVIDIRTHLYKPAKTMHKMYINVLGCYILAFPGECASGFTVCAAGKFQDHAFLLHRRPGRLVSDTDMGIIERADIVYTVKRRLGGKIGACHAFVWMGSHNRIGVVDACFCPVIIACFGAWLTVPLKRCTFDFIRAARRDIKISVWMAIFCTQFRNCHFRNRRNTKIPGKVLKRNVFGIDDCKRHHISMHHKQGTIAVKREAFLIFD